MRRLLVGAPVLLGACLAAFFLSFAGVFTDGPRGLALERLLSLGLAAAAHLLLGYLGTRFASGRWWAWGLLVAAPSLLVLAGYASREPASLGLCAAYAAMALGGGLGGAWDGSRGAHRQDG
ncbi:MAG: hypothetical protein QOG31_1255 [Thermoplasmata archaeon]|jgi:hypothetical protein|nr:hypothetical protein [Thermoplasmata archaeon]